MDERLSTYFQEESHPAPPRIHRQILETMLARREKRRNLILLSIASLLWFGLAIRGLTHLITVNQVVAMIAWAAGAFYFLCAGATVLVIAKRKAGRSR